MKAMSGENVAAEARRPTWGETVWWQFGAAIDMFDNTLAACPDELWTGRLWNVEEGPDVPPRYGEFWTIATHAIRWLERYLLGVPEDEFGSLETSTTLTPFPAGNAPQTKPIVRDCLGQLRERCRVTLMELTDEQAQRSITVYDWIATEPITVVELQLYNMRHVQEHAAQLAMFLGQHGVPDEKLDWVARAD
jgi:DinB superfamily